MKWIRLWTQETVFGSTFQELDCAERGIWFSLLAMAGLPPRDGIVELRKYVPYGIDILADFINCTPEMLRSTLEKLQAVNKIELHEGFIHIRNWNQYQTEYERYRKGRRKHLSEYERQKPYRQAKKLQDQKLKEKSDSELQKVTTELQCNYPCNHPEESKGYRVTNSELQKVTAEKLQKELQVYHDTKPLQNKEKSELQCNHPGEKEKEKEKEKERGCNPPFHSPPVENENKFVGIVVETWNLNCGNCAKIRNLDDILRKKIIARFKQRKLSREWFIEMIKYIARGCANDEWRRDVQKTSLRQVVNSDNYLNGLLEKFKAQERS